MLRKDKRNRFQTGYSACHLQQLLGIYQMVAGSAVAVKFQRIQVPARPPQFGRQPTRVSHHILNLRYHRGGANTAGKINL